MVKAPNVKRRDVGIAGLVVVLTQIGSTLQSSKSVSDEVSKFRQEFQQSLVDREQYFVRKADIENRLDQLNSQLSKVDEKVSSLKQLLRDLGYTASINGEEIIGCSAPPSKKSQGQSGLGGHKI